MKLHILPGCQMAFSSGKPVSHLSHMAHLCCSQQAAWDLGPDHLDTRLTLAVDAAPKPVGTELIVRQTAREERICLFAKEFDVSANRCIIFLLLNLKVG